MPFWTKVVAFLPWIWPFALGIAGKPVIGPAIVAFVVSLILGGAARKLCLRLRVDDPGRLRRLTRTMNVILVVISLSIPAGLVAKVWSGKQEQIARGALAAQALAAYKERKPGGSGQPVMRREVTVSVTLMSAFGELPESEVDQVIRAQFGERRSCAEVRPGSGMPSRFSIDFVIGPDGKVSNVRGSGRRPPEDEIPSCALSALRGLTFPKPRRGTVAVEVIAFKKPAPTQP